MTFSDLKVLMWRIISAELKPTSVRIEMQKENTDCIDQSFLRFTGIRIGYSTSFVNLEKSDGVSVTHLKKQKLLTNLMNISEWEEKRFAKVQNL